MASTVLGKVCITNKGAWSGTATYAILDVVTANGSSYLAKTAVPAGTQVTNTTYWQLIAAKGDKGNTGEITGASATINDSFGTPSVTVTPGGTSTERTFAFNFSNLKGNGIESIAKTGTEGAVDTYTITFSDGTTTTFDVTNGSVTSVDGKTGAVVLDDKANIDGYYVDLTAGSSEQLLSTVQIEDKIPYNFRTSGGSADIGNRLTDKIVGGTVVWNQKVNNGNFVDTSNWTALRGEFTVNDNIGSFTLGNYDANYAKILYQTIPTIPADRVVLISGEIRETSSEDYFPSVKVGAASSTTIASGSFATISGDTLSDGEWHKVNLIAQGTAERVRVCIGAGGTAVDKTITINVKNIQVFDLTQMFGTAAADYIYALDQSTAGAGTAWFKNLFPKSYYAYNAGEMLSVNVSSHDTVGFNAYDNASGKAKLAGGMEYQITGAYTALAYSTGETITPDANGYFTPSESGELTVTGGNSTDTCVHLVWDGEKDGEFEEYIKHSYPLDSSLTLRGVPILDANNKLYYDGDIYESDGTVTRRAVQLTLNGSEAWSAGTSALTSRNYFTLRLSANNTCVNGVAMSTKYIRTPISGTAAVGAGVGFDVLYSTARGQTQISLRPDNVEGMTLENFKALLASDPVTIIYLLNDDFATTETADPYQNPQIIDDFGTEEYVDYAYSQGTRDVAIPVGHDTLYMNNLRAKLEMSPDSPDGDGDYIVRQSGGENVYVPLTKELPAAPSEDGNYVLKVTVADGTPTYTWEVQA